VTEAVHAQQLVAEQRQRLLRVQEEERVRIARELHDSTSQHLVLVQFGLSALQRGEDPASVLGQMQHSLQEAQREIRNLSYLLHPPGLSGTDFSKDLRLFALGFAKRMSRKIDVRLRGPIDKLSIDLQHTLYHVVQEALSNVARHSNASTVKLSLNLAATGLRLTIRDNGTLSKRQREFKPGVGLMGMRTRIYQAGGDLSVKTSFEGVTISASFPPQL
jgi:signal transduction histidine kinase